MKVSVNWLQTWVNPTMDVQQLATMLTMAGLEVEAINPVAGVFSQVIVAKVITTTPHPNADNLTICQVATQPSQNSTTDAMPPLLQVVCGAMNVRAGLNVALAQIGALIGTHLQIKETTIRGQLSQGMLCSASELGLLDNAQGILELADDAPIGTDLRKYLALDDYVLDIDLTPNRADCLSMLGVAREVAALTQSSLTLLKDPGVVVDIPAKKSVTIAAPSACSYYCGRIIQGINQQAITPVWLQERLRRAGIRCVHPVVDVTNYVMLELGQPLHAFDANQLQGNLVVRMSESSESLQLLDQRHVTLTNNTLVIADEQKVIAIAGIMGGLVTAVTEHTETIFLESAYFSPASITGIARHYGLSTDAAQRFERGIDPSIHLKALERASALIIAIAGGKAGPITHQSERQNIAKTIAFKPDKVKQLTGISIPNQTIHDFLQRLGMQIVEQLGTSLLIWQVTLPSYRIDLQRDVDLVEEVIRLYGYDNIKGETITAPIKAGQVSKLELLSQTLTKFFATQGYHETISYSFVDPALQATLYPNEPTLSLTNPISPELSEMRVGLWPGLIASMIYNRYRQQNAIKLFELGVIFSQKTGDLVEHACIAGLIMGQSGNLCLHQANRNFDFYDIKGDLESLFTMLKLDKVIFKSASHTALHPGKSAQIQQIHSDQSTTTIGWCGALHPQISAALGIQDEIILFELTLKPLAQANKPYYRPISKFPHIRRDLSLLVNKAIPVSEITSLIKQTIANNWLKSLDVFDLYTGENIAADKKSLAIALTLQHDERTLVDGEINEIIDAIIKALNQTFAISLRE